MDMQYFAYHIYKIYALPFQVVIPVILWITAEILSRGKGRRLAASR
jgi:spore germination protein KB